MEIRQYLNLLRRWAWLLILLTVLGVAAGYVFSRYQTPVYQASTMILIMRPTQNQATDAFFTNNQNLPTTLSQMITTQPVIAGTSQRLGYDINPGKVTVTQIPNSDLIQVQVEDGNPQRAADIANMLVTVFLEQNESLQASMYSSSEQSTQAQIQKVEEQINNLQNQMTQVTENSYKQQVDEVSRTIANLQNEISSLQQEIVQLDYIVNPPAAKLGRLYYGPTPTVQQQLELTQKQDRLNQLQNLLAMYQRVYVDLSYPSNNNNTTPPDQTSKTDQIKAALDQYRQIYSNLLANYEAIRMARMSNTPTISQVAKAVPTAVPVQPKPVINMAVGGILGLLLASGFGFVSEYLDDTLRSPEEVSEILRLPVLGYIGDMQSPKLKSTNSKRDMPYVLAQPRSPVTEAFRSLRANLEFVDLDHPIRSLLITSSTISEGKTTIAINLAIVMAQLGRRVVLVDADLRRPRVHKHLGISNVMGLSDVLRNHATIQEVAQSWGNSNLVVITSGSLPPNPAEVLSSNRMNDVINDLKEIADIVVIDSPPSLLADASVMAARADGVLLVIQSNRTQMNAALAMIEQLHRVGAKVVGVALNRIKTNDSFYYYGDLKNYTSYAYDVEKTQPNAGKKI